MEAGLGNSGSIRFQPVQHDRGTETKVVTESKPVGAIEAAIARPFGEVPNQQLGEATEAFTKLAENERN